MKDFEKFVEHLVDSWRTEKKTILEKVNLGDLSNRQYGDKAETYVLKKVKSIRPIYHAYLTKGSQTPADIIAVSVRRGFWHIMLIQVKSSADKASIYKLNEADKKVFDAFGKFVKSSVKSYLPFNRYKEKPLIVSTGYCGVLRIEYVSRITHKLIESKAFKAFFSQSSKLDRQKVERIAKSVHQL